MTRPGYSPYEPQLVPVQWADGIWTVEGPEVRYRLAGVPLPCPTRMTVVRLPEGRLWLHSPIAYSPTTAAALDELGEVAVIVAPNSYHHVHVRDWSRACPNATVHISPDLTHKLGPGLNTHLLDSSAPAIWRGELAQFLVDLGRFKEVLFFHEPSRTLIATDLMQNFESERVSNPLTRLLLNIGGATGPVGSTSMEIRIAALPRRDALRAAVRQMLDWRPASIILSHGRSYRTDAEVELRRAFAWAGVA